MTLIVMFSVWGIINIVKNTFNFDESSESVYTRYQNVDYDAGLVSPGGVGGYGGGVNRNSSSYNGGSRKIDNNAFSGGLNGGIR